MGPQSRVNNVFPMICTQVFWNVLQCLILWGQGTHGVQGYKVTRFNGVTKCFVSESIILYLKQHCQG